MQKNKTYRENNHFYIENYITLPKETIEQILQITAKNKITLKVGKKFTLEIPLFKGIEELEKLLENLQKKN